MQLGEGRGGGRGQIERERGKEERRGREGGREDDALVALELLGGVRCCKA